jgi:formylglycine-generating enzyme required for sulfatase activity
MSSEHILEPDVVPIPAGEFLMGSDPERDAHAREEEQPQHRLYLPDYAIARTPVTNVQYAAFVRATGHKPPIHWRLLFWKRRRPPKRLEDHPVVNVSWYDARAYCAWLSEATGRPYRLPSEAEWEKAARSTDGRIYPWGDTWEAGRCNADGEREEESTAPVGAYPEGASPYGLLDAAGNVWEWTRSLWGMKLRQPEFKYPYDPADEREELGAPKTIRRVLRGGSFYNEHPMARCAARYRYSPANCFDSIGFRVLTCS